METQSGLILIIISYILNMIFFTINTVYGMELVVFMNAKKINAKPASLKFRALQPKGS